MPRTLHLGLHLDRLSRALAAVPADRLLLETDAPDQAPQPGSRGEPGDLVAIAEAAAVVRGEPAGVLLDRSTAAVGGLFGR